MAKYVEVSSEYGVFRRRVSATTVAEARHNVAEAQAALDAVDAELAASRVADRVSPERLDMYRRRGEARQELEWSRRELIDLKDPRAAAWFAGECRERARHAADYMRLRP